MADRTAAGHFRALGELTLSSIGLGTYLGPADDATDAASEAAVARALPFARSAPGMGTARAG